MSRDRSRDAIERAPEVEGLTPEQRAEGDQALEPGEAVSAEFTADQRVLAGKLVDVDKVPGELPVLDADQRARLDEQIARGLADVAAGRFITEEEFLRELEADEGTNDDETFELSPEEEEELEKRCARAVEEQRRGELIPWAKLFPRGAFLSVLEARRLQLIEEGRAALDRVAAKLRATGIGEVEIATFLERNSPEALARATARLRALGVDDDDDEVVFTGTTPEALFAYLDDAAAAHRRRRACSS